ncbi:Resolvase, N terminal domain [Streptoalloteichus tenebrarius]|uniref:Resolvase, N terminal domain n=1 Tax=Streptoalloteichus tenebrarius (strain ATCC 17920 / DSM 40477 / JCM 4838 / CBS 697.72 / NBRC 16177 / NCIMB 11028 / NRRL B-12390 / A12253. 1 / ISP 5477) TaxID=1933 RepID=A0ABT1HZY8_STRSD|nr:recombinase family protein [Streptoalloteichus tenebrarius]MCP2261071.1 Resolvase, N terminal domain [Streptoalloteichus tenebrarius]
MARGLLYAYAADYAAGDRQLRALRDWAAAHTHTVVSEVVSYRGRDGRRIGLDQAIDDLLAGAVDLLAVTRPECLSRDKARLSALVTMLGGRLVALNDQ